VPSISRYVSIAEAETEVDLAAVHAELLETEGAIRKAATKHNEFLKELGLSPLGRLFVQTPDVHLALDGSCMASFCPESSS